MRTKSVVILTMAVLGLLVQGCNCKDKTAKAISPCGAAAMETSSRTYPVASKGDAIKVEKIAPREVSINQPFDYQIKVTNLTNTELQNVVVRDSVQGMVKINSSTPAVAETKGSDIYWRLGTLKPKASQLIHVTAMSANTGSIASCAEVTYDSPICARINIVEPKVKLTKYAPAESLSCDRIPIRYVLTNNGNGTACDIKVKDSLAQGLMTSEGKNEVLFEAATLKPGESKEFKIMVDPSKSGQFGSKAVAMYGGNSIESNVATTNVSQPILAITGSGPEKQYIGRSLTYEFTVSNKGDGIAKNTVVEAMVAEDVQFDSATSGGTFTRSSPGKVTWNIGELAPNTSKKVQMTIHTPQEGELITRSQVRAHCAEAVSESFKTTLTGVSAILLEVIDTSDPIEVGADETYVIRVTNQGSSPDTNIRVECMFEDNMSYVSSSGPTNGTLEGSKLTLAPLSSLAPKATAEWRVTIKAVNEGDVRFKAVMQSDQLSRVVEETEATRFYKVQ